MKRNKGFTLIELIIALAVMTAVGMLVYTLFGQGFNLYAVEAKSAEQQSEMRLVLSEVTNKVRVTDAADINYTSGQLTVDDYVYSLVGQRVLRNSRELATGITAFNVSIVDNLLEITISNTESDQISTSLYLSN